MDHNQERRRGHFHRGRRGPDRRGSERRTPPQEHAGSRDQVDVEQIMRDIRARIAQRGGLDLSPQQIQELAARRLEAVLDPRGIKPSLLDELRRAAGAAAEQTPAAVNVELPYTYTEGTVYASHRGIVRLLRKLFKPLLMLVFNPTPVERALSAQAEFNAHAAQRDAERQREQAEWNALHYEIVRRMVADVARASLELQSLSMRVESLAAKVDFNERRVRHIEGSVHHARPTGGRPAERERPDSSAAPVAAAAAAEGGASAESPQEAGQSSEGTRRRRRRRRGRRGGGIPGEGAAAAAGAPAINDAAAPGADDDGDESDLVEDGGAEEFAAEGATAEPQPREDAAPPPAFHAETAAPSEPAPQPAHPAEPVETVAHPPAPETDRTE
jgi:hypothetical protein